MIPEREIDIEGILGMYFATILEIDSEMTLESHRTSGSYINT